MRLDRLQPTPRSAVLPTPPASHLSRRRLLLGAAAVGAAGAASLANRRLARAGASSPGIGLAVPIPYGLDFLGDGSIFHVEAPPFPGAGDDPSTVYNLRGGSAIAFIDGLVERTNRKTGLVETLPFVASDMRCMKGHFRGRDGHVRAGAFGFV